MGQEKETQPDADFVIRLSGGNVKPWRVPLRVLGRVLAAVQRLVDQRDDLADAAIGDEVEDDLVEPLDGGTRTLQLLKVTAASAGYAVSSANRQQALAVLTETGRDIDAPDRAKWHPSAISSIDDLSQIARHLGCIIEFRKVGKGKSRGDVIAMIRPETSDEIRKRAFLHGFTSVYGKLERVGGATAMRCGIHVQGRPRMLFCNVATTELVRELGKCIYGDVVLTGEAVWYRYNNQLKSLTVTSFSPAKTESFSEIARQLREAGGNAWDAIPDPTAYIKEMRG
jgi:hypothetical protein